MDISMPVINGVEAIRRLCDLLPTARVLILTVYDDDIHAFQGTKAGANGYLLKIAPPTTSTAS